MCAKKFMPRHSWRSKENLHGSIFYFYHAGSELWSGLVEGAFTVCTDWWKAPLPSALLPPTQPLLFLFFIFFFLELERQLSG